MSTALATLTNQLAARLEIGDGAGLIETLKATAFKGQVSDAQMTALLVVANQYGLNPWTKEIYAFPDKNNGIVPVVGVDGWSRIINSNPQFDGIDFEQDEESCTCRIYRKDRNHPISVTEYMSECKRNGVGPWTTHPKRMLRHKTMIQCARIAFGFGGIYEQDEAERIIEAEATVMRDITPKAEVLTALPNYSDDKFSTNLPAWRDLIAKGTKTADEIIATVSTKHTLTEAQKAEIRKPAGSSAPSVTYAQVADQINKASDVDMLDAAADLIGEVADPGQREELQAMYQGRRAEIGGAA